MHLQNLLYYCKTKSKGRNLLEDRLHLHNEHRNLSFIYLRLYCSFFISFLSQEYKEKQTTTENYSNNLFHNTLKFRINNFVYLTKI